MRHAGDKLADGGQLLGLQELRLCGLQPSHGRQEPAVGGRELVAHLLHPPGVLDFDRHVLRDLYDGGAVGRVEDRTGRDAEDAIAGTRDLLVPAAAAGGAPDRAPREDAATQADLVA